MRHHADSRRQHGPSRQHPKAAGRRLVQFAARTMGQAGINLDLPISRRNREFSALGNLDLQRECGGRPAFRLRDADDFRRGCELVARRPVESHYQLDSRGRAAEHQPARRSGAGNAGLAIFDFTTGQTVLVTAITGGNPGLLADRRNVWKLSGNWQPFTKADLRLRADYVHQTIARPVSNITVTEAIESAFPDRFLRNSAGELVSVDLRPVNFDSLARTRSASGSTSASR